LLQVVGKVSELEGEVESADILGRIGTKFEIAHSNDDSVEWGAVTLRAGGMYLANEVPSNRLNFCMAVANKSQYLKCLWRGCRIYFRG
jgi:hypothetical protein